MRIQLNNRANWHLPRASRLPITNQFAFMKKAIIHKSIWLLAIVAVGIILYLVFFYTPKFVPLEFVEARTRGSEIAKQLVISSDNNVNLLGSISQLDQEKNYTEALIAVSKAVINNRENNQIAVRLSSQLEILARAAADVKPEAAKQRAIEAVSVGVTLVTHLLKYNGYLAELFEILKLKFSNEQVVLNGQIQDLIGNINDEARTINDLNIQFNDLLNQFDTTFPK